MENNSQIFTPFPLLFIFFSTQFLFKEKHKVYFIYLIRSVNWEMEWNSYKKIRFIVLPDVPAMIEVFIIVDLFYILLNFVCLFIYGFFFAQIFCK